jgi:hypothetical protein
MHWGVHKLKKNGASYANNVKLVCRNYKSIDALHTTKKVKPVHNNYKCGGSFVLYELM